MQTLYTHQVDPDLSVDLLKQSLKSRIESTSQLHLLLLFYIIEVAEYVIIYAAKRSAKHIVTEADLNISTAIASNRIIQSLKESEELNQLMEESKIEAVAERELIVKLFTEWIAKESYKQYAAGSNHSLAEEKSVILDLLNKVIKNNEEFQQYLEGIYINYFDDIHMLTFQIHKAIENFKGSPAAFIENTTAQRDDIEFANALLEKTIDHEEAFAALIEPKLQNWELDRIASVDVILLKMAICELLYFETIPVKVSINEYIDLSKNYSTPKSREFINGVLDKLMKEMKEKGQIKKTGRGLLEN